MQVRKARPVLLVAVCLVSLVLVGASASPADARPRKPPRTTTTTTTRPPTTTTTTAPLNPCRNGYVGLTFDDGPTPSTPKLLDALRTAKIRATFFDVGREAESYPDLVRQQVAAGHEVGNHTYDHKDLATLSPAAVADEISTTQAILTPLAGYAPTLFRPPYGSMSDSVWVAAETQGLTPVLWTVDPNDWASPSTSTIVSIVLTVKAGGVVLLHDGYPNTIAAIPAIASGLASRGLCAGRIVPSTMPINVWEGLDYYATAVAW